VTTPQNIPQKAIQAIQSGDREIAKRLLADILRADPQNAQAWLWMSGVVETDEQRRECLLRVLAIDPDNRAAQAGLVRLTVPAAPTTHKGGRDAGARSAPIAIDIQPTMIAEGGQPGRLEIAPMPIDTLPERSKVERNIRLAGGLSVTLLLGLALLVITLIIVIPLAREGSTLASERVLHTATLWCPSCEREGQPVILSTRIGAGFSQGARSGGLPHGTRVSVLKYRWSTLERQYYALVAAEGKRGWVPETQIRR
jgi:hypothetical protein